MHVLPSLKISKSCSLNFFFLPKITSEKQVFFFFLLAKLTFQKSNFLKLIQACLYAILWLQCIKTQSQIEYQQAILDCILDNIVPGISKSQVPNQIYGDGRWIKQSVSKHKLIRNDIQFKNSNNSNKGSLIQQHKHQK